MKTFKQYVNENKQNTEIVETFNYFMKLTKNNTSDSLQKTSEKLKIDWDTICKAVGLNKEGEKR